MCVTHLIHYLGCGHKIPDVQATVNSRCDAVSAALIFYHDQPFWQPLEQPLMLPRTCKAVFRRERGVVKTSVLNEQAWWNEWMRMQFESNGFGALQRWEMMAEALGPMQTSMPNLWLPYPANQLRQYYALVAYQKRENKAPNVVFTTVPGGCGRGHEATCRTAVGPPKSEARGEDPPPQQ